MEPMVRRVQDTTIGTTISTTIDWNRDAVALARDLIGARLFVDDIGGIIVETEAYLRDDPASHSYRGPTQANAAMFGPAGHAYVYRSYGLHWCFNIVAAGHGAVLIRALAPEAGREIMTQRRGRATQLCSGPGRLCQALAITNALDRLPMDAAPFRIEPGMAPAQLLVGPRIGISKAVEQPFRFGLAGSRELSAPFRPASQP